MSTPKRPNKKRTLEQKKAILDAAAKNSNRSALAKQFGAPRTTINDIVSQKQSILGAIDGGSEAKRARLTSGKHQQMEEALIRWHKTDQESKCSSER
uniref:HTH psq-type domain-containing protein n=1 Tax=Ditylenchus dipsaci TaxID=166011 RepID=A0A915DV58_9BILA